MDKQKLEQLIDMLREFLIDVVKNPTPENVRFLMSGAVFLDRLIRLL